ncbi:MAG: sugar transferase [Acidimicrobiia bacterium]|nr:sugar transferase [Acidimicrobiia bacterium]NND13926.1 sugar transferase [Acidimicrobiia bacterium]
MSKRVFDLVVTILILPLVLPLMAVVAVAVRLGLGRPITFSQERIGKGGERIFVTKFRSMTNETGPDGKLLPDAERLVPIGRFLRALSLDELPELFLVLKGQMSLVGPRPLPAVYEKLYSPYQMRRHEVLPGITGLAQVSGRNALSWEERLKLDVEYVDSRSLLYDISLLGRTILTVVRGDGISADGHATMFDFTGSEEPNDGAG